jgi:4-hydroxybutyrate dehydrogenase
VTISTISYLTTVKFGFGAVATLKPALGEFALKRPLVITDKGVRAAGIVATVAAAAGLENAPVYDGVETNPTEASVHEALAVYREEDCDGIVAVGGGSPIDLAKATALLATHQGPLSAYAAIEGGVARIRSDMPPVIALPTTSGTGAEVGRAAVIVLSDGRKLGLISPYLFPRLAICDPDLTLGMPAWLTAATGMDALTHCVETYLAPAVNPPADAIALDGLRRCGTHLERAVGNGQDREARWEMMMAAMEGAMAFQKGLGAVHAMSHALGALPGLRLHHGTLNAVLLPVVLRFNAPVVGTRIARLVDTLGLPAGTDLATWIEGLNARLGMPANLAALGVAAEALDGCAALAAKDHTSPTNPRPASVADYRAMLQATLG